MSSLDLNEAVQKYKCSYAMPILNIGKEEKVKKGKISAVSVTNINPDERYFLVNKQREKYLKYGKKYYKQFYEGSFDRTRSGNDLIWHLPDEISKSMKKKTIPEKFNNLFGLTVGLMEHKWWIEDNELWEMGVALDKALVLMFETWRDLFTMSDEDLGIDSEYSRPALKQLLQQFLGLAEEKLEGVDIEWFKTMITA